MMPSKSFTTLEFTAASKSSNSKVSSIVRFNNCMFLNRVNRMHQDESYLFRKLAMLKTTSSFGPWLVTLKRIFWLEGSSTKVTCVVDPARTDMVGLNMVAYIGCNLRLEITVGTAVHSVHVLIHFGTQQFLKPCNQLPLWYLLLWRCQAFLEEQNLEQRGHV